MIELLTTIVLVIGCLILVALAVLGKFAMCLVLLHIFWKDEVDFLAYKTAKRWMK